MRRTIIAHEFTDKIPEIIEEGKIYISTPFATAVHKCCCGCGSEVVTPLGPTDWSLFFDGEAVSLDPSIGNWNFPCQSHYWIRNNKVYWARRWSQEEINAGRFLEQLEKKKYFSITKEREGVWGRVSKYLKKLGIKMPFLLFF